MVTPSRWRIIAIGKVRKKWIQNGLNLYLKRLPGLTITELRDSSIAKESQELLKSITRNELPIVLSEEGTLMTSLSFSQQLETLNSKRIAFLIGGADGLSSEIKNMAYWNISLSRLTFPHDIARLLLVEQLYRAKAIRQGSPYHRE